MSMHISTTESSDAPDVMMEINTTPLIDVMLVLLIMFIITIPAQLHSVNLNTPAVSAQPPPVPPAKVRLDVAADNTVLWNGQPLEGNQALQAALQGLSQQLSQPELHIHAHPRAKYAAVANVLASAQRQGVKKLGVVN
jgi:biopolymer transport protein ExbD